MEICNLYVCPYCLDIACVYGFSESLVDFNFRLDIPTVSPVKAVRFYEVNEEFGVDLLKELARAYSASSNTRSQVLEHSWQC